MQFFNKFIIFIHSLLKFNNIKKVLIIFIFGFLSRIFIFYFYDINVFKNFLNAIAIIYCSFMAFFVVLIQEFITYFNINTIPSFIINCIKFILNKFIKYNNIIKFFFNSKKNLYLDSYNNEKSNTSIKDTKISNIFNMNSSGKDKGNLGLNNQDDSINIRHPSDNQIVFSRFKEASDKSSIYDRKNLTPAQLQNIAKESSAITKSQEVNQAQDQNLAETQSWAPAKGLIYSTEKNQIHYGKYRYANHYRYNPDLTIVDYIGLCKEELKEFYKTYKDYIPSTSSLHKPEHLEKVGTKVANVYYEGNSLTKAAKYVSRDKNVLHLYKEFILNRYPSSIQHGTNKCDSISNNSGLSSGYNSNEDNLEWNDSDFKEKFITKNKKEFKEFYNACKNFIPSSSFIHKPEELERISDKVANAYYEGASLSKVSEKLSDKSGLRKLYLEYIRNNLKK